MDYKKVPQQINDVVGDNVKKLAQLFPSVVKDGEVDFEEFKTMMIGFDPNEIVGENTIVGKD